KSWPARVTVTAAAGKREKLVLHVPGDPERPFDESWVADKFLKLTGPVAGERAAEALGAMPECPRRGTSRAGGGNRSARKGLNPGLRPPQYQGVDIVRALVGVDHLEVDHVAHDAELVRDAVAAQHVAREARDLQRLAAGVALHDRGDLGRVGAFVLHA